MHGLVQLRLTAIHGQGRSLFLPRSQLSRSRFHPQRLGATRCNSDISRHGGAPSLEQKVTKATKKSEQKLKVLRRKAPGGQDPENASFASLPVLGRTRLVF